MTQPDRGLDGYSESGRIFTEEAGLIVAALLFMAEKEGKDIGWVIDVLHGSEHENLKAIIEKTIIEAPSEDLGRELRRLLTTKEDS